MKKLFRRAFADMPGKPIHITAHDIGHIIVLLFSVYVLFAILFWRVDDEGYNTRVPPYVGASDVRVVEAFIAEHESDELTYVERKSTATKNNKSPKLKVAIDDSDDEGVCLIEKPCDDSGGQSSEGSLQLTRESEVRQLSDAIQAAEATIDLGNALIIKIFKWRKSLLREEGSDGGVVSSSATVRDTLRHFGSNIGDSRNDQFLNSVHESANVAHALLERVKHVQQARLGLQSEGLEKEEDARLEEPPATIVAEGRSHISEKDSIQARATADADTIIASESLGILVKIVKKGELLTRASKTVLKEAIADLGGSQLELVGIYDQQQMKVPATEVTRQPQKQAAASDPAKGKIVVTETVEDNLSADDARFHHKSFGSNHRPEISIADFSQEISRTSMRMESVEADANQQYQCLLGQCDHNSEVKAGTIGDVATFMKNAADKLRYQLENWEPIVNVRMGRSEEATQWNPLPSASTGQPLVIIGLCTVQRQRAQYLGNTIASLLEADGRLSHEELYGSEDGVRGSLRIVVFNAHSPPSANREVAEVKQRFAKHIESGVLMIIDRSDPSYRHGPPPQHTYGYEDHDPFNPFARYYLPTIATSRKGLNWHTSDDEYTDKYNWLKVQPLSGRVARRWGDSEDRLRWRAKQSLDAAFLMDFVSAPHRHIFEKATNIGSRKGFYDSVEQAAAGSYFLMLEDDIDTTKHYLTKLRSWLNNFLLAGKMKQSDTLSSSTNHRSLATGWSVASFYNPWEDAVDGQALPPNKFFGMIGQLVRVTDLPVMAHFIRKNFDQSPLDWLMVDYLKKFKGAMVVHTPSLFEHLGVQSSLEGKEQPAKAADFQKD